MAQGTFWPNCPYPSYYNAHFVITSTIQKTHRSVGLYSNFLGISNLPESHIGRYPSSAARSAHTRKSNHLDWSPQSFWENSPDLGANTQKVSNQRADPNKQKRLPNPSNRPSVQSGLRDFWPNGFPSLALLNVGYLQWATGNYRPLWPLLPTRQITYQIFTLRRGGSKIAESKIRLSSWSPLVAVFLTFRPKFY